MASSPHSPASPPLFPPIHEVPHPFPTEPGMGRSLLMEMTPDYSAAELIPIAGGAWLLSRVFQNAAESPGAGVHKNANS